MLSTSARLLRLATLLQVRRHWAGRALAEELQVDARTVRRDVDRLRELGYPVEASPGIGGCYALGRGADLPPLVLDDEESVAIAIALRAASASIGGIEATALRLFAKLDQLLPARLRRRAAALHAVTLSLRMGEPLVDADLLSEIAITCRDGLELHFTYRNHHGDRSHRRVQPLRLANYGRRWYLVAWDLSRTDWRTFRVDRIARSLTVGAAFHPRTPPPDVAAHIERGIAYTLFTYRVTLRLTGTATALAASIPSWCGILEPDGDRPYLAMVGCDAEMVEGHALAPQLREVIGKLSGIVDARLDGDAITPG